ncbi:hypothetical protein F443_02618 [Phytophthora nicotianae P1569]|uniref:DUF659 domain-containing protein n=1 Tax=Phytophthora nicotianae P1569 TaxID=1317065 RepID=V9FSZ3_PHYNI|nr:hypothetical protein F443_02618 [Phytophthora nicotianae P1569]
MVANKQLSAYFFEHLGQGVFRCKIRNKERKQIISSSSLQAFGFVSEESSHLFQWIQWVVMRNMPVSEVEDDLTRAMSKLRPVTTKAVKKCMKGIAIRVGRRLEKELGTLFGLVLDGRSHAGVHYVGRYAVYEADGEMFKNILDVYNKTEDMVGFMVGDNCSTNQPIATKMGVPLVGCASHRFNQAVGKYLAPHEALLTEVHDLMVELRKENNLAELKKHTELLPVKRNVTRWSSTFAMVERYVRIRQDIKKVVAVEELIPTGGKHRKLLALFEHIKTFENVCKRLQRDETNMADVRLLFDSLVGKYPVMGEHLKSAAKIAHTPAFEAGVVKVINRSALSTAETTALKRFVVKDTTGKKREEREEDYASMLLQGKKKKTSSSTARYVQLVQLIPHLEHPRATVFAVQARSDTSTPRHDACEF